MELALNTREKPDNLPQSHQLLDELYGKLESSHSQHRAEVDFLKEKIKYLARLAFGAKTDHIGVSLFNEAELMAEIAEQAEALVPAEHDQKEEGKGNSKGKKKPRKIIPEGIPVERRVYDLPLAEIEAKGLHKIGEEVTKELDYTPGRFKVIEHVTVKYASRDNDEMVIQTQRPAALIPKSVAAPSLLSHIVISKYEHHLPLYRQEQIYAKDGIYLTRAVMANWIMTLGKAVEPLINLLKDRQLEGSYLQCDETPYRVLTIDGVKVAKKSYFIVTCAWRPDPIILYHHSRGRGSTPIKEILDGFQGYLQVDGYRGYDWTDDPGSGVIRIGCLAHIRRKFTDFLKTIPKKNVPTTTAYKIVGMIRELYKIEEKLRADPSLKRNEVRIEDGKQKFEDLQAIVKAELLSVAASSLYGNALEYADKELKRVKHYLASSDIEIDNNLCENAIRPFCLGKKNWLFAQTEDGGEASANIYSLIMTAKANKLNASQYLTRIIEQLPLCKTVEDYEMLLPIPQRGKE